MSNPVRLQSLDTLRGIAILMVVVTHVNSIYQPPDAVVPVLRLGNVGVDLFFLVSAFTMCHMWALRRGETAAARSFLIRRVARIAPPFWLAIVLYTSVPWLEHVTPVPVERGDIVLTALFLHGLSPRAINLVVPGGWSIAAEMSFYLVFPWLVSWLQTPRQRMLGAVGLYVVGVVVSELLRPRLGAEAELFLFYSVLTHFPVFLLGMTIYTMIEAKDPADARLALVLMTLWFAVGLLGRQVGVTMRPFLWLQIFILAGLVRLVLLRGWHLDLLSFLGRQSYSMYLLHFAVLDVLAAHLRAVHSTERGVAHFLYGLALVLLITGALAWISGRTVERYSSQIGRWIVTRLAVRSTAPA